MSDVPPRPADNQPPRWKPIPALDRRVLGVLVEKAKTTPDGYPMTVSGLKSGCNQKNNRYPLMEVEVEDIEEALGRLRALGAIAEVQGGGRVSKYRHYMYEWLGVEKLELAVMTELLLRGAQTEGELRGRAARMDPIPDLPTLRTLLNSLKAKGLVIALSPEGRGHVITHALYEPREMEKVQREFQAMPANAASHDDEPAPRSAPAAPAAASTSSVRTPVADAPSSGNAVSSQSVSAAKDPSSAIMSAMRDELVELRQELSELRSEVEQLKLKQEELWTYLR